ncbi:DNA-directed RNA polymerase subunit A' [Candidatus Pacearchaeota archaeon]|jgi:DNA-directed RNA polymerase subunit A'|nr:DNA-directed RNA polymerase subunit A' [Candidatus Pacearchaeota archaeon]|tara:strand:- start:8793 stop:12284 length:3492 start_codon:yes stop_codon:yes gene_type:complete
MQNKPIKKKIAEVGFSLFSPEQIKKVSTAKIVTPELYDIDGYPVDGGLMDLRLGAIDPGVRCRTCGGRLKECLGHPGRIDLARSIIHLKYVPLIEMGLRCFCHDCKKLLIDDKDLSKYSLTQRAKKAKDAKKCPHCKIAHEKVKLDKPTNFHIGKKRLFPTKIREMLVNIPDEELKKIGVDPASARPEWAVLTILLVPSVTIRPSIILESGERSEDDLTHKLSDIIRANQRLWENLNAGAPEVIIEDLWDLLQFHVTTFFDNTVARIPPARHRSGQPLKTITERIKGKEGRIRKNLAGKRVNFSGRTVISPDPSIGLNEVGIPYEIAKIVTVSETVNDLNIEKIKKLVEKAEVYPGANYVIRPDGKRKKITPELKEEIINELVPGYKIERQLQDGDIVLFNRHPSLHRGSLMSHFVKVLPGRTFRLHPAVTFPYNADFDGDEMNIHSPQTEEARAEAKILLDVKRNLISPKNNTNLLGCAADAITGNYLLGLENFPADYINQITYQSDIDSPTSKKTISGTEVFSQIFPNINFSNSSITIKDGKVIKGNIDKTSFGQEDGELIKRLDKLVGRDKTIDIIRKVFNLGKNYLTDRGITISVEDLNLDESVINTGDEIIKKAKDKTSEIIESYNKNELDIIPGKTKEESREIRILQVLNEVRTKVGEIVKKEFPKNNPVNHMIMSGGGGNILNITQIACFVGQQDLDSKRIDIGYNNRTLSFFKKGELSPRSRGFIDNSFMKGLRPDEFFFGSITGRSTLMDTALRTPKSGYLYRRLANALQDIKMEYDGTVRDSNNNIIQFKYSSDGLDVSELHTGKKLSSGEAIGLITAQSFGEPSTQMVLRTFHFAGVAEMQVTMGLPRLIEIFDARKKPSSPKMEIYLEKDYNNEKDAKVFAEKIKEVTIKEIASEVNLNFTDKRIEIKINREGLRQTHTSIKKVVEKLNDLGFKAKEKDNSIILNADELSFKEIYKLKEKLKETIISGVKGIKQILIVKRERDFIIMTLGTNLKKMIELKEVNKNKLISNDLYEVAGVFGIEAARNLIIDEIKKVINTQGLDINIRHLELVSDAMTNTGEIKGITRMGIIAQKESILARATFETPDKQFVNASIKGGKDKLTSVIENIILNQPVPIGTGLPGLLVKIIGPLIKKEADKKLAKSKVVERVNK